MNGQNPPIVLYAVPMNGVAQPQGVIAPVYQSPATPPNSSNHQGWGTSPHPGQDQATPTVHTTQQGQYPHYIMVNHQHQHQVHQVHQQAWGVTALQPQGLLTPQIAGNQWHVPQLQQHVHNSAYNSHPGTPQQQQRHQPWISNHPGPPNPMASSPTVQSPGQHVRQIPRGQINHGNSFGSPRGTNRGYQQQHGGINRSQVKPNRKPRTTSGTTTPQKQDVSCPGSYISSEAARVSSSGPASGDGAKLGLSGAVVGEATRSETGVAEGLYCEPCDKDFATETARQAHILSHEKCWESGCEFSASRKVLSAHHSAAHGRFSGSGFQMISVEGRKFRVLLGTSPEDVEQWRAARRHQWPSEENMARKEEEWKKRNALGCLGPDEGYAGRGGRGGRGRDTRRGRGRGGVSANGRGQAGYYGPSDAAARGESNVSDESVSGKRIGDTLLAGGAPLKVAKVQSVESLPAGADEGGGSDGAGHEEIACVESKALAEDGDAGNRTQERRRICTFYLKGKCAKGENCTYSHDVQRKHCSYFMNGRCYNGKRCNFMHDHEAREEARREGTQGDGVKAMNDGPSIDKQGGNRPNSKGLSNTIPKASNMTLLRKLLAPQLHRENSIALQAVRFIVNSNFFLERATMPSETGPTDVELLPSATEIASGNEKPAIHPTMDEVSPAGEPSDPSTGNEGSSSIGKTSAVAEEVAPAGPEEVVQGGEKDTASPGDTSGSSQANEASPFQPVSTTDAPNPEGGLQGPSSPQGEGGEEVVEASGPAS